MKSAGFVALVVGLLSLVGAIALVGWYHYRDSHAAFTYAWRIEYGNMPGSDTPLIDWLKSQPGVTEVSVTREGKVLVVTYEIKAGEAWPEVLEKANSFGYAERGSFFGNMQNK